MGQFAFINIKSPVVIPHDYMLKKYNIALIAILYVTGINKKLSKQRYLDI
jgi:hypothetical protein